GYTVLPRYPKSLYNRRFTTAVGTKAGVLIGITGHGPNSTEGGTFRHRSGSNSTSHYYHTHQERENPLTYKAASYPPPFLYPPVGPIIRK
ncbi:hypothetical protein AVEN_196285-2-1, partial [Araneus ventricosus]